jgi:hypothetical protein
VRLRFIVWCKDCRHQVEPDPAEMAERYGAATTVQDWYERLRCSHEVAADLMRNSLDLRDRGAVLGLGHREELRRMGQHRPTDPR